MKSSAGFEPVSVPAPIPAPAPTPAPVKTFQTKSLFVNEKLKILNLSFEFQYVFIEVYLNMLKIFFNNI